MRLRWTRSQEQTTPSLPPVKKVLDLGGGEGGRTGRARVPRMAGKGVDGVDDLHGSGGLGGGGCGVAVALEGKARGLGIGAGVDKVNGHAALDGGADEAGAVGKEAHLPGLVLERGLALLEGLCGLARVVEVDVSAGSGHEQEAPARVQVHGVAFVREDEAAGCGTCARLPVVPGAHGAVPGARKEQPRARAMRHAPHRVLVRPERQHAPSRGRIEPTRRECCGRGAARGTGAAAGPGPPRTGSCGRGPRSSRPAALPPS